MVVEDTRGAEAAGTRWQRDAAGFWVIGVGVLFVLAGHLLAGSALGLTGKTYDWAIYFLTAAGVPLVVLGVPLLWRWRGWPAEPGERAGRALTFIGVAWVAVFAVAVTLRFGPVWLVLSLLLATAQTAILEWVWRAAPGDAKRLAGAWMIALAGWLALATVHAGFYVPGWTGIAGFAAAFLLTTFGLRRWDGSAAGTIRRPGRIANGLAVALLVLMSLRTEHLFEVNGMAGANHHWGGWVGTADLMRQGAWPLWDAPSNYGLLNVAVINALPTRTPWQGFYLAQSAAFIIVSVGIYAVVRAGTRGWMGWLFGLVAACAIPMYYTPFLDPAAPVTSTFIFPNWGPYRYVICFILLFWLVLQRLTDEDGPRSRWVLAGGCAIWLVGVLWSTESAWFCSGTWLPAYAVMAIRRGMRSERHQFRTALGWLALPAALLAATVAGMEALWRANLGHGPDWIAALDYVLELGTNVMIVKQSLLGSASIVLLGFLVVVVTAAYRGVRDGGPTRSLSLCVGLIGTFVAVATFAYQRGIGFLHPVAATALLAALALAARERPEENQEWAPVARGGAAPLLALSLIVPLTAAWASPGAVVEAARSLAETARHGMTVEWMMPDADPELQALLRESGATAETPLFFAGDALGNMMLPWTPEGASERVIVNPQWSPGHPVFALRWIPPGRDIAYVERYLARHPQSGWLIQSKTGTGASVNDFGYAGGLTQRGFTETALETHVPTEVRQSEHWQMTWWERDEGQGARPEFPQGIQQPLPPDVVVDGVALAEATSPEVWATFGRGWNGVTIEGVTQRGGMDGAELWVYSPEARVVRVEVPVLGTPGRTVLAVNGSVAAGENPSVSAEIALEAGWTPVSFTLADSRHLERKQEATDRPASSRQSGDAAKVKSTGQGQEPGRGGNRPVGSPTAKRAAKAGGNAKEVATPEGAGAAGAATPGPNQTVQEGDREGAGADEGQRTRSFVIGPISITTVP